MESDFRIKYAKLWLSLLEPDLDEVKVRLVLFDRKIRMLSSFLIKKKSLEMLAVNGCG